MQVSSQDVNNKDDIKVKVGIHYLKDLSIENVNSPGIYTVKNTSPPKIDVNYDISVSQLGKDGNDITSFEVLLQVNINSKVSSESPKSEHTLFICEIKYAGIFSIDGGSDEEHKKVLFIYAPGILFPFLRRIASTATGDCGFPPLMLEPVDFANHFTKQDNK